jgi:D-amino-acid dehydrogenase
VSDLFDVIVVGAGVVGTAAAYRCVQLDRRTLLIDSDYNGRASQVAAGIVSPTTAKPDGSPHFLLARASAKFYPKLLAQLIADGGASTGYSRCGEILVAQDDAEADSLGLLQDSLFAPELPGWRMKDEAVQEISISEAKSRFPVLGEVKRALWVRDAARVDGRSLRSAMCSAAQRRGLELKDGAVDGFLVDGRKVAGVRIGQAELLSKNVIIAAGSWSAELCRYLDLSIDVRPQRGQLVHLRLEGMETSRWPMVRTVAERYIVAWPGGRLVAGATSENGVGWDARPTAGATQSVLNEAISLAPTLEHATLLEVRVGLRPVTERGYPLIGPLPRLDGCFIAAGHGSDGLAYGPWSGYAIAELCLGFDVPNLEVYAP